MNEFDLIRRFFRGRTGSGVLLGPGDDAALLLPSPGLQLAMTMDTLLSGRHFPEDLPAADIGWRSLAVNLSDLAAMGATPRWCLLSLSLPQVDELWLEAFCAGFDELAHQAGIALVGGDVVRGPLSITVQATGEVPVGKALLRSGARPGDRICLSGVPGQAAASLQCWQAGKRDGALVQAFCRPQPQLDLGRRLRGLASACIDISDGLLADLGHILEQSGGLGADIRLPLLPRSAALNGWADEAQRQQAQLAGGDDYLLLFTVPPVFNLPAQWCEIGRVEARKGIRVVDAQGNPLASLPAGWDHFGGDSRDA
ncbi:MAG: thiamine-phosphate kinase [Alcanivoracaceae bacterium]|nr:thiamine-phosphate kinase [Alcanivoracaceae bacterium]